MNSGRFDPLTGRIRPGTYVNVDSSNKAAVSYANRGNVLIPLINHNWGPNGKLLVIKSTNISEHDAELGNSVDQILLLNEAFKGAGTVLVYIVNKGTAAKATSGTLTITAKYGGTRGNDIKIAIVAETAGTFTIKVILGTSTVETFTGVADCAAAVALSSNYVVFSGTGSLAAAASISLTDGAAGEVTNADITTMLDSIEDENVSAIAFPIADDTLKAVLVSKIKYLRDSCGKSIQGIVSDYAAADYEGIINVTNAVELSDGTKLTHAQATSYVAAITASANELTSNTYKAYPGADDVVDKKTNEQAEAAISAGEFFFTKQGDTAIVEYDINSLHTFSEKRSASYRKNKVIRVYDAVSDTIRSTFPPNRFPNSSTGWDLMDGLCQTILNYYLTEGAIQNVDLANDMKVDRANSTGDSVFFNARIHAVDAAEKLYFQIITD